MTGHQKEKQKRRCGNLTADHDFNFPHVFFIVRTRRYKNHNGSTVTQWSCPAAYAEGRVLMILTGSNDSPDATCSIQILFWCVPV